MGSLARRAAAAGLPAVLALAVSLAGAAPAGPGPLRAYLPSSGAAPGWSVEGEPQEFEGEDLYDYIDGGAEIYHEYGFRRVAVQDYRNEGGLSVSLEIFEMASPESAYGMYTFKRSGSGRGLDIGRGGELESYYLNFWRGRFLVTLTGFDESRETADGLLALGGKTAAALPDEGREPVLAGALPRQGLRPGSVKYLKGPLGLNNVHVFWTPRGLTFSQAVRGLYDGGETLILLEYGTAEARRAAWTELRAGLQSSGRYESPTGAPGDAVVLKDGKGRFLAFAGTGSRLAVGIHSDLDGALAAVARAR